jgi:O-antigen/teichoic acid export membrane protein
MGVKRNSFYNLLGSIAPLALSLFVTPPYLKILGPERYGVLAIVWLLLGYFGAFDLGLGRAVTYRISSLRNSAVGDTGEVFWSAFISTAVLSMFGGFLLWITSRYYFSNHFNSGISILNEISKANFWLLLALPIASFTGLLNGALQGKEKFLVINFANITNSLLFQILPLIVAFKFSNRLDIILPVAIISRLIGVFVLLILSFKYVLKNEKFNFSISESRRLLTFGGWVTISMVISPLMVILDRFIIGIFLGSRSVSNYSIPFDISSRTTTLSNSISSALFSRFTSQSTGNAILLVQEVVQKLSVFMTPLFTLGIILMTPFLSYWISEDFSRISSLTGKILLIGFFANSLAIVPYTHLQARSKPKLISLCHLFELLPYFILLSLGLKLFGIPGAAMAFTIRAIFDFFLLSYFSKIRMSFIFNLMTLPLLILVFSLIFSSIINFGEILWVGSAFALLVFSIFWSWRVLSKSEFTILCTKIKSFRDKLSAFI